MKATADVQAGNVPAGSAVVLKKDGTAAVYTAAFDGVETPLAEGDRIGFTKADRRSEADGALNVATLLHCTVRYSKLTDTAKAVVDAADTADVLGGINLYHQ